MFNMLINNSCKIRYLVNAIQPLLLPALNVSFPAAKQGKNKKTQNESCETK